MDATAVNKEKGTSISYLRLIARELTLGGKNQDQLFTGTDFNHKHLLGNNRHIDQHSLELIFNNALRLSGNPALGLRMGELLQLSTHGKLGLVVTTTATLEKALEAFVRYTPLRENFITFSLIKKNNTVSLVMRNENTNAVVSAPFVEMMVTMVQQMMTTLVGRQIDDVRVELAYATPSYSARYKDYIHGPVTFDCKVNRVIFPKAVLSLPCLFADPETQEEARDMCERALQKQAPGQLNIKADIRDDVTSFFEMNGHHICSLHDVAASLNLSSRTLTRRLGSSGTTFRILRDLYLKQEASQMLTRTAATVDDIAFFLGYDNSANFRRAFMRWYNMTPSEFRERAK